MAEPKPEVETSADPAYISRQSRRINLVYTLHLSVRHQTEQRVSQLLPGRVLRVLTARKVYSFSMILRPQKHLAPTFGEARQTTASI